MTNKEKNKIASQLREKKQASGMSDKELSNAIGGISLTSINHIIKNRYEDKPHLVSEEYFRKVASWLGVIEQWNLNREDANFVKVQNICYDAQQENSSFAISAAPGMCKSAAAEDYASRQKNVYYVRCQQHFTRKAFLSRIMQAMGMTPAMENACEMCDRIIAKLNSTNRPLLIIDEADKLHDNLFQFFITFYNDTFMNCGFVFLGSHFFRLRVLKGVNKNRQGYAEFYSRIGRDFISLKDLTERRVAAICKINGVDDPEDITRVFNQAENDMRRVKRVAETIKKEREQNLRIQHKMQLIPN